MYKYPLSLLLKYNIYSISNIYLKYFLHLHVMGNAHGEVTGQISVTTVGVFVLAGAEDHQ